MHSHYMDVESIIQASERMEASEAIHRRGNGDRPLEGYVTGSPSASGVYDVSVWSRSALIVTSARVRRPRSSAASLAGLLSLVFRAHIAASFHPVRTLPSHTMAAETVQLGLIALISAPVIQAVFQPAEQEDTRTEPDTETQPGRESAIHPRAHDTREHDDRRCARPSRDSARSFARRTTHALHPASARYASRRH